MMDGPQLRADPVLPATQTDLSKTESPQLRISAAPKSPPNPRGRGVGRVAGSSTTSLYLPSGNIGSPSHLPYAAALLSSPVTAKAELLNGVLLVASLLWEGRRMDTGTMRLTKAAALRFVSKLPKGLNPTTFVCERWGCTLLAKGSNINGNKTNVWSRPPWVQDGTETLTVHLTPHQLRRWKNRRVILIECSEKANPPASLVRQTLTVTTESARFAELASLQTSPGAVAAVQRFRECRTKKNITRDGDIQSVVSRLPEPLRAELLIDGSPVAEFDIKSAHAVLLGMFYNGESGAAWLAERNHFNAEAFAGSPNIYGPKKAHKLGFLSALNQSPRSAHHSSVGYREFERLFPLLAAKIARIRWRKSDTLVSILRNRLAVILRDLLVDNHADAIPSIPIVDSVVVAMPGDLRAQHRAAFRTAYRLAVPLAKLTGAEALIEGSNGENYRFVF